MNAEEMEGRITSNVERSMTTVVSNIEHTESITLNGRAIIKIFLQPGASVDTANAQITSISQSQLHSMPPGTPPPFILTYNASTVPILQLALSSNTLSEAAAQRLRAELHPARPGHHSRRGNALPLRRQTAPGQRQPEYRPAAVEGPVSRRRRHRHRQPEHHSALPAPPKSGNSNTTWI